MCRTRCALALVVLYVGLAQSWDIAVTNGDLLDFYTNDNKTDTIRLTSRNLKAIIYNEVHNIMLFVDKQTDNDAICSYNISSKINKCLTERNGRNIHGFAFDPATELLFFSDTNERSINWLSLKRGSTNNVYGNLLIKMGDGIPTDVAVDSCRGYVYWINTNLTTPVIERARFNGAEREVVINTTSLSINTTYKVEPRGLAIDPQTQNIYWVEPETSLVFPLYYADLNGNNKTRLFDFEWKVPTLVNPSTNTLIVSKTNLLWMDWCATCTDVWKFNKILSNSKRKQFELNDLRIEKLTFGLATNYKIEDKIPDNKDCEPLTSLTRNDSDWPFCVYGMKVNGQSRCLCTPGYIGERCDVAVCDNYCLQGTCSFNYEEGLPKCRCNAGYSGERCEVSACHDYCLNNGNYSLNEKSEPNCQCKGDYMGDRCEVSDCLNYCMHGNCSFNEEGLPECRCNAGYSGERCEVYACHGYCLNNGVCSLSEEDEPFCLCVGNHEGPRCAAPNVSFTFTNTPTYSVDKNADLLSNWRKPTAFSLLFKAIKTNVTGADSLVQ